MPQFDAIVVGAGPSGAMAARDLARRGAHVAIVDGSHPREKPCGGGVTERAFHLAAAAVPPSAGQTIDTVTFEAGGRAAGVRLPDPQALTIFPRAAFDAAVLAQAIDAGAVHVAARAGDVERAGSGWRVEAGGTTLSAPWVLGADGPAGVVRKHVFRRFERRQLSIAAGCYVDGVETKEIVIGFIDEPCGYLWSFPRPGHLAVGTCAQADETTTAEMHAITDRWLDRYLAGRSITRRRYAWPIPSLGAPDLDAEQPAGDGWMLLGDAAGLVDPITREGIFFALRSGMLAAMALGASSPGRVYAQAIRDELHEELRRAARLKAGFYTPRFTRLLIDALAESPGIRRVMIDLIAGRQPYRGLKRRLLGTLEFGLAIRALTPYFAR